MTSTKTNCALTKLIRSIDGNLSPVIDDKHFVAKLEAALEKDSSAIDAQYTVGYTALMMVVCKPSDKYVRCANLLIKHGADPNIVNYAGETALTIAAVYGNTHCVKLLLNNKADVNRRGDESDGPLMTALLSCCSNFECVQMLIDAGADVNYKSFTGLTPLMCATHICDPDFGYKSALALVNAGADVNHRNSSGRTALDMAINLNRQLIIGLLSKQESKHDSTINS